MPRTNHPSTRHLRTRHISVKHPPGRTDTSLGPLGSHGSRHQATLRIITVPSVLYDSPMPPKLGTAPPTPPECREWNDDELPNDTRDVV